MNHEVLTLDEIDGAFEQAFPGHDLHDESVEFARAVERIVVEKMRAEVEALRTTITNALDALNFDDADSAYRILYDAERAKEQP